MLWVQHEALGHLLAPSMQPQAKCALMCGLVVTLAELIFA